MNRGYTYAKDKVLAVSVEEIKALEEKNNGDIEIKEFVDASQVDLLHVEKSYHLSPDKGGDRSYTLLSKALERSKQFAVAQWTARGKVHLVIIRAYGDGLVLHQMFYASEIREFESDVAKINLKDAELDMACSLIATLRSETYDPSKYVDTYKKRVEDFIEKKLAGSNTAEPETPVEAPAVIDLFAALQASLNAATATKKAS